MENLYDYIPNDTSEAKEPSTDIKRALRIVKEFSEFIFPSRRAELELIVDEYLGATEIEEGGQLRSSLVQDVVDDRVIEEDFLSYEIKFPTLKGVSEEKQAMTKKYLELAYSKWLDTCEFNHAFTGNQGVRFRKSLFGLSYTMPIVTDEGIRLKTIPLSNVCVGKNALDWEKERRKEFVVMFSDEDFSDFINGLPEEMQEKAKKIAWGRLAEFRSVDERENNSKDNRIGDWGIYFNIPQQKVVFFGGSGAEEFFSQSGEEFPYRGIKEEAQSPVFGFIQHFKFKGYFPMGDADRVFQESRAMEKAERGVMRAMENATTQVTLITTNGDEETLKSDLAQGMEVISEGGTAILVNKVQNGDVLSKVDTIGAVASGINECAAAKEIIEDRLTRKKIQLRDTQNRKSGTLGEFKIEQVNEESEKLAVSRRQSNEYQRLLEYLWNMWMLFGDDTDETPVYVGKNIEIEGEEFVAENKTMGEVLKIARLITPMIVVDEDSGIKANKEREIQNLTALIQSSQGTPMGDFYMKELASIFGYNNIPNENTELPQQASGEQEAEIPLGANTGGASL